jgi:hypothetical protein
MTGQVCLTVDVEDWYDGMAVLGESVAKPSGARSGLTTLAELVGRAAGTPGVTLFTVGEYAPEVGSELRDLAAAGHEIASHGPDHGRLPDGPSALAAWLVKGRTMLEDLVQVPVRGFRSPRFDLPSGMALARYRDLLAEAGFEYVSDTRRLGAGSPVRELPVLTRHRFPAGGGSYQRLVPVAVTSALVDSAPDPAVLYYHSYDFGATLPPISSIRSWGVAKQLMGRGRVQSVFSSMLARYGSEVCARAGR